MWVDLFSSASGLASLAVIVFLFVHMLPGDPARLAAGPEADEATVKVVRAVSMPVTVMQAPLRAMLSPKPTSSR